MFTRIPHQCDDAVLRRYLAGELAASEEEAVVRHLDDCPRCQRQVEALAATPVEWEEVQRLLGSEASPLLAYAATMVGHARQAPDTGEIDLQSTDPAETRLAFLTPTDDPEMLGRLGPYEIKGLVGQGGMGLVLKAYDRALQRTVAIKVLAPQLATSALARRRFAREAQAAAAVAHEHVIAIHAVAEAGGLPYLVMPYMPGQSLQHRLDDDGPLTTLEVLRIGSQIAAGLAAAHAQGLVHRDIKPANILLEQGIERVAITDFGLARTIDDASLTRTGVLAGTPAYMSPEQARGETVDHRADLFSLGSVMYAMCAGRPPFRAEATVAVLKRICEEEPTPLADLNADVPPWLARIIARLHAKSPADRFATAQEVADLLQRCLAHVQNPAAAPLPAELEEPRRGWRRRFSNRARLISAAACASVIVAAVMFWGPWNEPLSEDQAATHVQKAKSSVENGRQASSDRPQDSTPQAEKKAGNDAHPVVQPNERLLTHAAYQSLEENFKQGRIDDPETLYQWSLRLMYAERSGESSSKSTTAARGHLERMQRLEELVAERGPPLHKDAAMFYRLEAEVLMQSER